MRPSPNDRSPRQWLLLPCFAAWFAVVCTATAAPPPAEKSKDEETYLRLRRNEQSQPVALEVAVVRFQPADRGKQSPVVDLVGAVHVGEPAYFAELNKRFADYDAVLYELVAVEGTRPPRDRSKAASSPISTLQTGLTELLNLQFQLEGIDYQRANMVHADLSPEEFRRAMHDRGETVWSMFLRMVVYSSMQQAAEGSSVSDLDLLMALLDKNRALALKRVMAKQFENLGGVVLMIDGPKGSALIRDRNTKALDVLRRELDAGKQKIAIFYGAGHMPDLAKRLTEDFGLRPTGTQWLRAWDMSEPEAKKSPAKSEPRP